MQEPRKIDAQVPVKLFTDCEYSKQPENTIRFALNVVSSSLDGSLGSIPKENGNELCITIDDRHADNKSNLSSLRTHSKLIKIGFLDFIPIIKNVIIQ